MRSIRLFIFGLATVGLGISPLLYSEFRLNMYNWDPLTMAVPSTGDVKTPEFVPDYTGMYVVTLAFDPNDVDRQECLIGNRLNNKACSGLGSGLGLTMSVAVGDRLIVDHRAYQPFAFGGVGEITTELGRFQATRNQPTSIVLGDV